MSVVGVLLWLCFTGLLAGVLSALYVREQHRLDECNTRSEQQSTQSTDAQRQHREAEADLTQRAERAIHRKEVELATLQRTTQTELALIHFHHRPFLTHVQHAVYDLQGFGTLPPGDLLGEGSQELYDRILAAPPGGCGAHKLAFLQRTLRGCLDHGGSAPPTRADYERYYATLPPPALAAERENVIGTLFQKRLDAAAASGPLVVHQLGEAVGPSDAD